MSYLVCIWAKKSTYDLHEDCNRKIIYVREMCEWLKEYIVKYNPRNLGWSAILVLPEYYLTKFHLDHSESKALDELTKKDLLSKLQKISKDYPDILLIPGTIAYQHSFIRPKSTSKQHSNKTPRLSKVMSNLNVDDKNFTFRQSYPYIGSPTITNFGAKDQFNDIQMKIQNKGEDEIIKNYAIFKNKAHVLLKGEILFKYHKQKGFFETAGDALQIFAPDVTKSNTTEIRGNIFCFEICFEHGSGVAKEKISYNTMIEAHCSQYFKRSNTNVSPDIHIVMSDMVENSMGNNVVKPGGIYIHASTNEAYCTVQSKTDVSNQQRENFLGKFEWQGGPLMLYWVE